MSPRTILVVAAVVSTGLAAGLLFGWLVSVIPGTARTDDRTYIHTMQNINVAIVNPAFLVPFFLTPVGLIVAAVLEYRIGHTRRAIALGSAAGLYLLGVLGVTAVGNIPLNNALENFDLNRSSADAIKAQRQAYEEAWNRWHTVRTTAAVGAFIVATTSYLETP